MPCISGMAQMLLGWALYIGDGIEMVLGCALNREERHSGHWVVFCMLRGGTEMVPSIGISMCPNC